MTQIAPTLSHYQRNLQLKVAKEWDDEEGKKRDISKFANELFVKAYKQNIKLSLGQNG